MSVPFGDDWYHQFLGDLTWQLKPLPKGRAMNYPRIGGRGYMIGFNIDCSMIGIDMIDDWNQNWIEPSQKHKFEHRQVFYHYGFMLQHQVLTTLCLNKLHNMSIE